MKSSTYQTSISESPCEKWNCSSFVECGLQKKACMAFYRYVNTGRAENPELIGSDLAAEFPTEALSYESNYEFGRHILMGRNKPSTVIFNSTMGVEI